MKAAVVTILFLVALATTLAEWKGNRVYNNLEEVTAYEKLCFYMFTSTKKINFYVYVAFEHYYLLFLEKAWQELVRRWIQGLLPKSP